MFMTFAGAISCHAADFSIDSLQEFYSSKIYVLSYKGYDFQLCKENGYVDIKKNEEKLEIYFGWNGQHYIHMIPIKELKIKNSIGKIHESDQQKTYNEVHIQYKISELIENFDTPITTLYELRIENEKLIAVRIQKYYKDHNSKDRIIESFQLSKMAINKSIYLEKGWNFR